MWFDWTYASAVCAGIHVAALAAVAMRANKLARIVFMSSAFQIASAYLVVVLLRLQEPSNQLDSGLFLSMKIHLLLRTAC